MFNSNCKTMKNIKVISVLVVSLLFVTFYAGAAVIRKGFNNYEIEVIDNLHLGKNVEKVWSLKYEGSEVPVTVIKRNTNEGVAYVVNSKYFEVCYLSSSTGFGARTVKKAWSSVPNQINDVVLNSEELRRQKILSPSKVNDEKALGLIASYLPNLLNEQYTHLLN